MNAMLQGAWELIYANPAPFSRWRGIIVFSTHYYSFVQITRDRRRFISDPPTPIEEAEAFRTLLSSAGPYEVQGQTLILHEQMSGHPNGTGNQMIYTIRIENRKLVMQGTSPDNNEAFEAHWQRLSD